MEPHLGGEPEGVRVIVALGSNVEPRADYLARARAALAAFPAEIELAAEAGRNASAPERRPETGQTPEKRPETAPAQAAPVPLTPKQSAAPKPRERTGDVLWRDAGDGSLFTVYKNQPYRAIPMAAWGLPTERMVEKRTINGVEYAIFALKDGKIV